MDFILTLKKVFKKSWIHDKTEIPHPTPHQERNTFHKIKQSCGVTQA